MKKWRITCKPRSLVSPLAGLFISERGELLRGEILLGSGIDHPSEWKGEYLAAFEKVVALTPLILPSVISCCLMTLGLT